MTHASEYEVIGFFQLHYNFKMCLIRHKIPEQCIMFRPLGCYLTLCYMRAELGILRTLSHTHSDDISQYELVTRV